MIQVKCGVVCQCVLATLFISRQLDDELVMLGSMVCRSVSGTLIISGQLYEELVELGTVQNAANLPQQQFPVRALGYIQFNAAHSVRCTDLCTRQGCLNHHL